MSDNVSIHVVSKSADQAPLFPLTVIFADGEKESVDSVNDAECNLEWIDTDDNAEPVTVVDRLGRPVHLKIEALRMIRCELKDDGLNDTDRQP